MTEFKVKVEDEVVASVGQENVEKFLSYMVEKLHLKAAARDILADQKSIDLENDPEWKQAREEAWNKYMNRAS
jgi:hypothetical protein